MGKVEMRRKQIIKELSNTPIATITELGELLGVSLETIRKDLEILSTQGLVLKVHGGAALAAQTNLNSAYDIRTSISSMEKKKIAKAACKLIKSGDSIILESSTTTLELSKVLVQNKELLKTLVIITNSFNISAMFDENSPCNRLFFLGGWTNGTEHSTKGQYTAKQLESFHVEKAFISGASLSESLMLTSYYEDDMAFQKQAIASAKSSILLIDSSKRHKSSLISVCHLSTLTHIVTDISFVKNEEKEIKRYGTIITQV